MDTESHGKRKNHKIICSWTHTGGVEPQLFDADEAVLDGVVSYLGGLFWRDILLLECLVAE